MSSKEITPNPFEINPEEWERRHAIVRRRMAAFDALPDEAKKAYKAVYDKWMFSSADHKIDILVALAQLRMALVTAWGHEE
jgi:hypothetical protein